MPHQNQPSSQRFSFKGWKFSQALVVLLILANLLSCGYEPTEKDKFPDMPEFPKTTNASFKVTQFPHEQYSILGKFNGLLYVKYSQGNNLAHYGGKIMFAAFNDSYKSAYNFPIDCDYVYPDKFGNLYTKLGDTVTKYALPNFKSKIMRKFPHSRAAVYDDYNDTIQKMQDQDSTFDARSFVDEILKNRILKFSSNQPIRYMKLHGTIILYLGKKEYWSEGSQLDCSFMTKIDDLWIRENESKSFESEKLFVFDDAGLKNESTGNHFTVSFYHSGLEYFDLVMEGDSTKFKYPNERLDGESLVEVQGFDQPYDILLMNKDRDLFRVEYTKP